MTIGHLHAIIRMGIIEEGLSPWPRIRRARPQHAAVTTGHVYDGMGRVVVARSGAVPVTRHLDDLADQLTGLSHSWPGSWMGRAWTTTLSGGNRTGAAGRTWRYDCCNMLGGAYTYDAYGNSAQASAPGPAYRYAGMRFDVETGLYYTPNRAYDPQDGRWMQLDPIGIKDGLNQYAYVKNDPVNMVDADGRFGVADAIYGAIAGGVGGYIHHMDKDRSK